MDQRMQSSALKHDIAAHSAAVWHTGVLGLGGERLLLTARTQFRRYKARTPKST